MKDWILKLKQETMERQFQDGEPGKILVSQREGRDGGRHSAVFSKQAVDSVCPSRRGTWLYSASETLMVQRESELVHSQVYRTRQYRPRAKRLLGSGGEIPG